MWKINVDDVNLNCESWVHDFESPGAPAVIRVDDGKPVVWVKQQSEHPAIPHPYSTAVAKLVAAAPDLFRALEKWEAKFEGCDADDYVDEMRDLIVQTRAAMEYARSGKYGEAK